MGTSVIHWRHLLFKLDKARVSALWEETTSFYDRDHARSRLDWSLVPEVGEFIRSQFRPESRVLDIGCGTGKTLLMNSDRFAEGVGIDEDKSFLDEAEQHCADQNISNVSFRHCKAHELPFGEGEFDFVFSERGPLPGASINIQAGLRVLKPYGLIFAETIGEHDGFEVSGLTSTDFRVPDPMSSLEQVTVLFARNGVEIRTRSSFIMKRYYADMYEFLRYAFSNFRYRQRPFEVTDDFVSRAQDLYQSVSTNTGEIPYTTHRIWIGGVKTPTPRNYWEWQFFPVAE